jgi:hypothetical protein
MNIVMAVHPAKQRLQSRSTERGMQIDSKSSQPSNALSPISLSIDPDSIFNDFRDVQWEKDRRPTMTTEAGMEIDFKHVQNPSTSHRISLSFDPNANVNVLIVLHP